MVAVALNGIAKALGWLTLAVAGTFIYGCASTEYPHEGVGQPTDRAAGAVPDGELGVCRVPLTRRPLIVDEKLWERTRYCTARTPARFIRIGQGSSSDPNGDKDQERILQILAEGKKDDGTAPKDNPQPTGNQQMVSLMRALRDRALKDPYMKTRVSRETSREGVCDYSFMLNKMAKQRDKLAKGDKCAVNVFDPEIRGETCLFDTKRDEVVWLTSSWSCVTRSGKSGDAISCFTLCAYDDYCAKQVPCAAADTDLLLCMMGVCVPEARAGF